MAKGDKTYSARELTAQLKLVAMECETTNDDGDLVTNAEVLARTIWKKALGYMEDVERANGEHITKVHAPASWAIQVLLERLEGKVAATAEAGSDKITVTEKISELAIDVVNRATASAVSTKGPPTIGLKEGP